MSEPLLNVTISLPLRCNVVINGYRFAELAAAFEIQAELIELFLLSATAQVQVFKGLIKLPNVLKMFREFTIGQDQLVLNFSVATGYGGM